MRSISAWAQIFGGETFALGAFPVRPAEQHLGGAAPWRIGRQESTARAQIQLVEKGSDIFGDRYQQFRASACARSLANQSGRLV